MAGEFELINSMRNRTLNSLQTTLTTALSSSIDSIDVAKMSKGSVLTAATLGLSGKSATTTSNEVDARGYNAILIAFTISGAANWTIKVQGSLTSGGTYFDIYQLANTGAMAAMSYQTNASRMFLFKGLPDYIKIVATEDAGAETISINAQLLNV
jgi:hypothetical protein